jgi:hypothetical protein
MIHCPRQRVVRHLASPVRRLQQRERRVDGQAPPIARERAIASGWLERGGRHRRMMTLSVTRF